MSWVNTIRKLHETQMRQCNARSCKYNRVGRYTCMLPSINILRDGSCEQYEEKEIPSESGSAFRMRRES